MNARFSFGILGLGLSLATACSGTTSGPTSGGTSSAEVTEEKASCASVGGTCVGVTPTACASGLWADATDVSCGPGVGVGCCLGSPPPPPPPGPTACEQGGGQCVALTPTSCASGWLSDATTHSCGGGLGVACCMQCPEPNPPVPCPNGTIEANKDAHGCTTGFTCKPPSNACAAAGGTCVGISPSSCPSGRWADASTHPCGTGIGVGCCLP